MSAAPGSAALVALLSCAAGLLPQAQALELRGGLLSEEDPCRCLNWKKTYTDKLVECGEYAELGFLGSSRTNLTLEEIHNISKQQKPFFESFCTLLYEKMDHDQCINKDDRNISAGTWCYVSSRCSELNGGEMIADKVAPDGRGMRRRVFAKMCKRGRDLIMPEHTPRELWEYASGKNLNAGMLALVNYEKVVPTTAMWQDIRKDWINGRWKVLPGQVRQALRELRPIVLYAGEDYYNHLKIIWGEKLVRLDRDEAKCPRTEFCYEEVDRLETETADSEEKEKAAGSKKSEKPQESEG